MANEEKVTRIEQSFIVFYLSLSLVQFNCFYSSHHMNSNSSNEHDRDKPNDLMNELFSFMHLWIREFSANVNAMHWIFCDDIFPVPDAHILIGVDSVCLR